MPSPFLSLPLSCADDTLESNVSRVLPKLLPLFLRPSAAIRDHLTLICNHVNKRLHALPNMKLPVAELMQLYQTHANDSSQSGNPSLPFFVTFTLMYVEKGFARLTPAERASIAHQLLPGIAMRSAAQKRTLLHTFFSAMTPSEYQMDRVPPEELERRWLPLRESTADQAVLLEFMLDALLWAPVFVPPPPKIPGMLQPLPVAPTAAQSAQAAAAPAPEPLVPDGLSAAALATLTLDHTLSSSAIQHLKASCLHFLTSEVFTQNQILPLAIAGSSVGSSDVVHAGESLLKRLKNIDLEDVKLATRLFDMYLGSMDAASLPADQKRRPASFTIKVKIIGYLARSKTSVTLMQPALKVTMDTLFSPSSTNKLKNLGLLYLGWFMNQANPAHLHTVAPVLLNAMLKFLGTCKPTTSAAVTAAATAGAASGDDAASSPLLDEKQTSTSIVLAQLRGAAYQLIGQLSIKRPDLFNKNLRLLSLFFRALQEESNDTALQNIHEGLSMLRSAYVGVDAALQHELQQILLTMMAQSDRRIRLNALQCLNRLFPYQDVLSRYLCLFLSVDPALEIRDESSRGLVPFVPRNELEAERERQKKKRETERKEEEARQRREREEKGEAREDATTEETIEESKSPEPSATRPASQQPHALMSLLRPIEAAIVPYPSFSALVSFAHAHLLAPTVPTGVSSRFSVGATSQLTFLKSSLPFEVRALPRLLDFLADTLRQNAFYATEGTGKDAEDGATKTKSKAASGLTDDEIQVLTRDYVTKLIAREEAEGVPAGEGSLLKFQALVEHALSQRVHDVQSNAAQHLVRLVGLAPSLFAPVYASRLAWIEQNMLSGIQLLRAAMADLLGLIASGLQPNSVIDDLINRFAAAMQNAEKIVGPTRDDTTHGCVLALGVLVAEATRRNLAAGFSAQSDEATAAGAPFSLAPMRRIVLDIARRLDSATLSRTPHITAAAIISLGRIGEVGPLPIPHEDATPTAVTVGTPAAAPTPAFPASRHAIVASLFALVRMTERKGERVVEESIKTLGLLVSGDSSNRLLNQVVDGFFAAASNKHEELHFAIGEALSAVARAHQHPIITGAATAASLSLTPTSPTESKMDTSDSSTSPSSSPPASTTSIPEQQDLLSSVLPRLFKLIGHGSALQRAAASTWLLCIVKFAWSLPAVMANFQRIQASFSVALTDSNQFVQEVAAKGMSILYEHSTGSVQQELIDALMKTFSSGQRKVTGDTVVVLDEERGEFSTYKELCEVAKDMQKPDLVYNFLDLAAHHSIWSSKLGAAFSLSSILQVNNKIGAQIGTIIPKLYRYQFDTNTKIQESMKKMWLSLVTNPREAINQHFDAIMTDLLESMGNRQYRVRSSSCLALCELLHGRNMAQLDPHLEKLWVYTFRDLDDVNGDVRKHASSLAAALSHLSIRLCDTQYSNRASAQKAMSIVLPVLLTQGVAAKAKEIQSVSIRAVLAIIKIGGPNLRPHLATLLGTLLESMSNLEPQVFSYLQFHAQSMQMTDEQLERARLNLASGGVLADAVASCLLVVDAESVPSIIAKLTDIIHTGLGLPTLTAAAKFVVSLVNSKVAPDMREHIVPLLTQLMQGLSDQSPTLRKVYADAIGYLCKIAKRKRVEKLLTSLIEMYVSEKSTETSRLISGFALRSIVRQAGDTVRTNFMLELVPVAFLASHDNTPGHPDIAAVWAETFEELVPGLDAGVVLYIKECAECARRLLDSQAYALRHIALLSLKHLILACKSRFSVEVSATLPPLLKLLPGRVWTGKEVALDAIAFLAQECGSKLTAQQARDILAALAAEMARQKTDYKREAIRCFGKAAACFPFLHERDTILLAKPHLQAILDLTADSTKEEKKEDATASASSSSSTDDQMSGPDLLLVTYTYASLAELLPSPQAAVTALYALRTSTDASAATGLVDDDWYTSQSHHASWVISSLLAGLEKGFSWTVRVAILVALKRVFEQLYTGEEIAPTTAGDVVPKKSFGASLVQPAYLGQLADSLLKPTGLGEPKYPLVKARAIETMQAIAQRPAGQRQTHAHTQMASGPQPGTA